MAEAPYEIVIGPAEVYVAPVGEAFPDIDEAPAGNWLLVGLAGADNYSEDGVIIRRQVSNTLVRPLGSTVPVKAAITETGFEVEFTVMDLSPEAMQLAFGGDEDDITSTVASSGVAGNDVFDIVTDPVPIHKAVLVRCNQSSFGNGFNTQFEVFSAFQTGSAEGTFSKSDPFMQTHIWTAIKTASGFVRVRQQTAAGT